MLLQVKLALIIMVSIVFIRLAQAQEDWHVTVFDGEQILILNADGIDEIISVPQDMLDVIYPVSYDPMILSPDKRYFASVTTVDKGVFLDVTIRIADLHAGTCCVILESPIGDGFMDIHLGVFDEGSRFFTATIGYVLPDTTNDAMIIVDAQTGKVTHQVDPKILFDGARFVEFLDWNDEGIYLLPRIEQTLYYGDFIDTNAVTWNPENDEIVINNLHFDGFYGDWLPTTGEYLRPKTVLNGTESDRVIEVIINGDESEALSILEGVGDDFLPNPHWVLDGQAYLIRGEGSASRLIFRGGTIIEVPFEAFTRFVAGTPDGWLMQQTRPPDERTLYHFTYVDGDIVMTPVMTFDEILQTLQRPELGNAINNIEEWVPTKLD